MVVDDVTRGHTFVEESSVKATIYEVAPGVTRGIIQYNTCFLQCPRAEPLMVMPSACRPPALAVAFSLLIYAMVAS